MRAPLMVCADAGQQRQQQQHDGGQAGGVGERLEPAVVAQHDEHARRTAATPSVIQISWVPAKVRGVRVVGLVGQVDAVDHRQAEAVERGDDRQQDRVGVRREDADHDVAADDQPGQPGAVGEQVDRQACRRRRDRRRRRRRCRRPGSGAAGPARHRGGGGGRSPSGPGVRCGSARGCSWRLGARRAGGRATGWRGGGAASGWALAGGFLLRLRGRPSRSGSAGWLGSGLRDGLGVGGSGARRERARSRLTMPRASSRLLALIPSRTCRGVVRRQVVQRQVAGLLDVVHAGCRARRPATPRKIATSSPSLAT